jgi:UDP-GlcNAc:undecaprenyl-phosphate GlcNAc-1-phosphate transferase
MIVAIAIYCVAVAAIAAGITYAVLRRRPLIDKPNERSSHAVPTPRGGGLGILGATAIGVVALGLDGHPGVLSSPPFLAVTIGGIVAALAGLADDMKALSFAIKLGAQAAAAFVAIALGLCIETIYVPGIGVWQLGWLGMVLTILWLVGMTNAYNFMDGIDGLAGGTAAIAAAFLAAILIPIHAIDESALAATFAAAALGFLFFNLPPARIFMGDVGSQFLGFGLAAIGLLAARDDTTGTIILIVPLLLFHFVFDTVLTAFLRWRRGDPVWLAHRSHLYQRATPPGTGHGRATALLCVFAAFHGLLALWMMSLPEDRRWWAFVPALGVQIVYAVTVLRRAPA